MRLVPLKSNIQATLDIEIQIDLNTRENNNPMDRGEHGVQVFVFPNSSAQLHNNRECAMFGLGPMEIAIILLIVLVLFGAKRIPEVARGLGKGIREFKSATSEISRELTVEDRPPAYRPPAQQNPPGYVPPSQEQEPATANPTPEPSK